MFVLLILQCSLKKVLDPLSSDVDKYSNNAEYIFDVEKDIPICSMVSTEKFLVIGTCGEISGWDWKSIADSKSLKPCWKILIPDNKRNIDRPDVNSLWWNENEEKLFAGCGDNNIYSFDISNGKLIRTYEGHSDYIHSIQGM